MNKYYLKNELFDVFENARILFNDYYNGKENYSDEDIEKIKELLRAIKEDIKNIEEEVQ